MTAVDCGAARRLAWGTGDRLLTPLARGRASAHVAQCADCRRFVTDMERMRDAVRQAAPEPAMPDIVAARIHQRIAAAHASESPVWWRTSTAILTAAAAVMLIVVAPRRVTTPPDVVVEVAARQQELLSTPGIESTNPAEVQGWLLTASRLAVHIPTFTDARLTGATITRVGGRAAAVVRFQVGNRFMTYTVIALEPRVPSDTLLRQSVDGELATATWRAAEFQHVWVGAVPAIHLASFARRCAEQARTGMRAPSAPTRAFPSA